ncbi:MAG: hypothetical protein RLZZ546_482 [Bacteroidota bacterium]|jgi:8-oxo-dGTP pyrophosphatase MutT (NUDIX family)
MDIQFIERLERELEEELPGRKAHLLMAPLSRQDEIEIPDDHIHACVLLLLFPKNKEWHIVLIERADDNPHDHHAGQISLPGGRFEDTDYSYQDCALREAEEEIGINASDVGVIGELSQIYIPISNYLIYPFIGFMSDEPEFSMQKSEVKRIIDVLIKSFIESKYKKITDLTVRQTTLVNVPYYDISNRVIWGATAMILSEFESIIKKVIK